MAVGRRVGISLLADDAFGAGERAKVRKAMVEEDADDPNHVHHQQQRKAESVRTNEQENVRPARSSEFNLQ